MTDENAADPAAATAPVDDDGASGSDPGDPAEDADGDTSDDVAPGEEDGTEDGAGDDGAPDPGADVTDDPTAGVETEAPSAVVDEDATEADVAPLAAGPGQVDLQLLNINDFHGRIDGALNEDKTALTSSTTVDFASTVVGLQEEYGTDNTLFISAGDNVGASLFPSAIQGDVPTIDLLNLLGLEATAVGNHEFDAGWSDVSRLADLMDGPLLGANVYIDGEVPAPLESYTIVDTAGLKIAVIGVVTQETPTLVNPQNIEGLTFGDPIEAVNRVVGELEALPEAEQPDIIVAEYHEGSGASDADGTTIEEAMAESPVFAAIVNDTSPAVDVIFTGHTHQRYAWDAPIPGTDLTRPILETGSYGAAVGQVVLTVDTATNDVVDYTVQNVPVEAGDIAEMITNPVVAEAYGIILEAVQFADVEGSKTTGYLSAPITRAFTGGSYVDGVFQRAEKSVEDRGQASTMGTLVSNMLKESMSQLATPPDFGVTNPGGLRTDLYPAADGAITVAQARAVLPFNNELSVVTLTGAQVITMLEQQWQRDANGAVPSRAYLQLGLSENVSYTYSVVDDPAVAGAKLGVIESVFIDGVPIDPEATYRIGTFSFLASGGDNFWVFGDAVERLDTGLLDWQSWLAYLATGTPEEPHAPDFVRQGVQVEGLPDGDVEVGRELELVYSGMNIHSVGAPANTELTVSIDPLARAIAGSAPIETVQSEDGVWTDSATVTATVPDSEGAAMLAASAAPTGTIALNELTIVPAAVTPPPAEPAITIDPDTVKAGGTVTVTGTGFVPGETVTFTLGDTTVTGTATVGEDGTFSGQVTISSTMAAGTYPLTATASGGDTASASLTVTAASTGGGSGGSGSLPSTGADTTGLMLAAALLAILGAAATVRARTAARQR